MKLSNWRTAHFWMLLLTQGVVVALLYLLLFSPAHVIVMAALALALLAMNPTMVATAEAWFPPSVLAKLSQGDLVAIVARGEAALLSSLTQPPATQPTVVATETKSVTVTDMPVPPGMKSNVAPLVIVALLGLTLAACAGANAWVACELGKLPQTAQVLIPDVTQALEQGSEASALAALEAIGSGLAAGQLECIVEAIAADTQKKVGASRGTMAINAAAYLQKHTARLACDRPKAR